MKILIIQIIILLAAIPAFADKLFTADGTVISCKILKVTESSIEFAPTGSNITKTKSRNETLKIEYDNGKTVMINETVEPQSDIKPVVTSEPAKNWNDKSHRHDGFYFNFMIGPGIRQMLIDTPKPINQTGASTNFGIQLGYALFDNLAFFGEERFSIMSGKKVKPDKYEYDNTPSNYNSTLIGFGIRYYLMPYNYFISFTYNVMYMNYSGKNIESSKNANAPNLGSGNFVTGQGATLSFGKEWWISDNWGAGAAIFWFFGQGKTNTTYFLKNYKSIDAAIGINFSITYN
jgi:hypothetical protein